MGKETPTITCAKCGKRRKRGLSMLVGGGDRLALTYRLCNECANAFRNWMAGRCPMPIYQRQGVENARNHSRGD